MLATTNYPILDAFFTILWFFLWVLWIFILIRVLIDIFRSHDLSGAAKALWFVVVLVIPFLGVLAYLIVRGDKMHEHDVQSAQHQQEMFRNYMRQAGGGYGGGTGDQLSRLADLHNSGKLSDTEYEQAKAKVLSS